jgi:hypothetical protein
MTYCVALRLNAGMVFLSDSRTNAGVDQIGTLPPGLQAARPAAVQAFAEAPASSKPGAGGPWG